MHMLMVIAGGTVLLGVFLLFGHLWGGTSASFVTAAQLFITVWLAHCFGRERLDYRQRIGKAALTL